MRSKWSWTL